MDWIKMVGIFTGSVLFFLSLLHIFWALGGRIGYFSAIPEVSGKPAFTPGRSLTLLVALALFGFGMVAFWSGGSLSFENADSQWFALGISFLFLGRAIGDFRLVGFFKKIRSSRFARNDDLLYSPVCVLLSASYFFLGSSALFH
ncbi:DUF3995 domain-containing protein [Leptospira langatensis]|uniref:DUF3995 domain-containing protein n=1 Tax=Leptospira langatensis TaxID=2484983 RepID=A0A5F1ZUG8_9LEPT|nr:DUF3995 domain-containing protein [Leptospira langatensis]TGJ98814.1 DUF3995 domain-containing protein [Leptospira langatensis]TGL40619.1 DUF3995 domain-containing protein [Leptospira langatensis]